MIKLLINQLPSDKAPTCTCHVLLSGLTDDEPTVVKQVLDMGEEVSHHFTCFVYTCTCTCIRCVHVHYVLGTFIYMYMYNLLYLNYNVHI